MRKLLAVAIAFLFAGSVLVSQGALHAAMANKQKTPPTKSPPTGPNPKLPKREPREDRKISRYETEKRFADHWNR